MKKIFKIAGIIFLIFLITLCLAPFAFKGTIKEKLQNLINENLKAEVQFSDVSMNVFADFPNISIDVEGLKIINKAPFEGDTLFVAKKTQLSLSVKDIFKKSTDPYRIVGFKMKDALAFVHVNALGQANYDIALTNSDSLTSSQEDLSSSSFDIEKYQIENMKVIYKDDSSNIEMIMDSLYHKGQGNFKSEQLDLSTSTSAQVTVVNKDVNYLKNIPVLLDAVLAINLKTQTYTFKDNRAKILNLPLIFSGSVQLLEDAQDYNISFETPTSDFNNFLTLIPQAYTKSIKEIQTQGEFFVKGEIQGQLKSDYLPKIDVKIHADNAQFKYPDLPKSVSKISLDAQIFNNAGKIDDTTVEVKHLTFQIDQDVFQMQAKALNIVTNPSVALQVKGVLNLANINQAYPITFNKKLQGVFDMDFSVNFDMNTLDRKEYEKIMSVGDVRFSNVEYRGEELASDLYISDAKLKFKFRDNANYVELLDFRAKTGKTDINFAGRIDNLYGYLFGNQKIKGNFKLKSDVFDVNDFLVSSEQSKEVSESNHQEKTTENLKIPSFLDCSFNAEAKEVIYSTFHLKNASALLIVKDESVVLKNLNFGLFNGKVTMDGQVSAKNDNPTFSFVMDMDKLDVFQSFTQIEMLRKMAPISDVVQGDFNSKIRFLGELNSDFTPNFESISADVGAFFSNAKVKENQNSPLLSTLSSQMNFLEISQIDLSDLKVNVLVENSKVVFKPFHLKVADADVQVSGTQGFDQSIHYDLLLQMPTKYLGSEVKQLLSKIPPQQQKMFETVSLPIIIKGTLKKPEVSANMGQVAQDITQKITEEIKRGITQKGVKVLEDLLKKQTPSSSDTTENKDSQSDKDDSVKQTAKKVIEGIFNL